MFAVAGVRVVIKLHAFVGDIMGRRVHVGTVKAKCSKMPIHEIQSTTLQFFLPSTWTLSLICATFSRANAAWNLGIVNYLG